MMFGFFAPQLASRADMPHEPGWLYQPKIDGHRAIICVGAGDIRIFSRNGHDRTKLFAGLLPSLRTAVTRDVVLDGEICVEDGRGRSDFSLLCAAIGQSGPLHFKAFDLLQLDGLPTTALSTTERLIRLSELIPISAGVVSSVQTVTNGRALADEIRIMRGEGVVAKRADAPYRPGQRHPDWVKVKFVTRQEFIAIGWHEDSSGRMQSLVLSTLESGGLTYRGCVGTGFSEMQRRQLRTELAAGETLHAPFVRQGGLRRDVRWTDRPIVVEVEYLTITALGSVREPRFVGVRHDKDVADVVLELV